MTRFATIIAAFFSATLMLTTSQLQAGSNPYEFHADAKMAYLNEAPIDKAYGYMNVFTDNDGNGLINVMFSNASQVKEADFNASVKFLNHAGSVVKEEKFNCWIDSGGIEDPIECKISKFVTLSDFESIEVDFFLTDVTE